MMLDASIGFDVPEEDGKFLNKSFMHNQPRDIGSTEAVANQNRLTATSRLRLDLSVDPKDRLDLSVDPRGRLDLSVDPRGRLDLSEALSPPQRENSIRDPSLPVTGDPSK